MDSRRYGLGRRPTSYEVLTLNGQEYRIIRTHGSLMDLEKKVVALGDVQIHGAPFRDLESREWCQAVTVRTLPAGQVKLKEPRR